MVSVRLSSIEDSGHTKLVITSCSPSVWILLINSPSALMTPEVHFDRASLSRSVNDSIL
jgi:hypothetical protein